jgi:hypothetical protein
MDKAATIKINKIILKFFAGIIGSMVLIIVILAMFSKSPFEKSLIGTWIVTGNCVDENECNPENIEFLTVTFTEDGLVTGLGGVNQFEIEVPGSIILKNDGDPTITVTKNASIVKDVMYISNLNDTSAVTRFQKIYDIQEGKDILFHMQWLYPREKKFGTMPETYIADVMVKRYLKNNAHDPDSIDIERLSDVEYNEKAGWIIKYKVYGNNVFGAKVMNVYWFVFNQGLLIDQKPYNAF